MAYTQKDVDRLVNERIRRICEDGENVQQPMPMQQPEADLGGLVAFLQENYPGLYEGYLALSAAEEQQADFQQEVPQEETPQMPQTYDDAQMQAIQEAIKKTVAKYFRKK